MNPEIKSSVLRPDPFFKPHHLRHLISGTLVFALGILTNEALVYYRAHRPAKVAWAGDPAPQVQTNYVRTNTLPTDIHAVQLGFHEDGTTVWRKVK